MPEGWLGPRLDALAASLRGAVERAPAPGAAAPAVDPELLLSQIRRLEDTLVPVVGAAVESRAGDQVLAQKMVQIIELLEQLDARISLAFRPR